MIKPWTCTPLHDNYEELGDEHADHAWPIKDGDGRTRAYLLVDEWEPNPEFEGVCEDEDPENGKPANRPKITPELLTRAHRICCAAP